MKQLPFPCCWLWRGTAGAALACTQTLAQPATQAASGSEPPPTLESVLVIGERTAASTRTLAGSLDIIGRDELEYEHVDDTLELFSKIPGAYLGRYNQGIINTDVAIRGFAVDGVTPHAKLLIDGIPSNYHNGYNELDQLFPLGIESIEVYKGTGDPRYGLFNVAGNYNVTTRADTGSSTLSATYGSLGVGEVQGYTGIESGRLSHSYAIGYRNGGGYRDHTDLAKFSLSGRWFYQLENGSSLGFIARHATYDGDSPGYLTAESAKSDPESSADYANQDGGDKTTGHYSLHFDQALGDAAQLAVKAYWQNFERERWVRFSAGGSLGNRYDDQDMAGLIATLSLQLNETWNLRLGADLEDQDVVEQRFGTIDNRRQVDAGNVVRNRHYEFNAAGGYVQIENTPTELVSWNAGVRVDRLDGDFVEFDGNGVASPRDMYDFGTIVQPTLNVFISPSAAVTLFGNYGRSFQHPLGKSAYAPSGRGNARDVSLNDGWEAGLRWTPRPALQARASYWRQDASDEWITLDGTARNVGETQRDGIDLGLTWGLSDAMSLWANYTTVNSEIVVAGDGADNTVGREIRSIPDFTASVGVQYSFTRALTGRLHVDAQGDYHVNEANLGGEFGDFALANLSLEYSMDWGEVSLQVNNLLDEYYEYVYDFSADGTATVHSPGDGVNLSLSVNLEL